MGKGIRALLLLAVLGVIVYALVMYSSSGDKKRTTPAQTAAQTDSSDKAKDKPQVQEKYGIAPVGEP